MRNTSIQRFATREQIARIERLAAELRLDRTDILIDAEEQGAISRCDTYEDLSLDEATKLLVWLQARELRVDQLDAVCHECMEQRHKPDPTRMERDTNRTEREWVAAQTALGVKCADWNTSHPIGVSVTVRRDGAALRTRTNSCAILLRGKAVIAVDGVDGFVPLDSVTPNGLGGAA